MTSRESLKRVNTAGDKCCQSDRTHQVERQLMGALILSTGSLSDDAITQAALLD